MTLAEFDRLPANERDLWVVDWEFAQATCPDCGNSIEKCSDPSRVWYPYRRICYASMERESSEALYKALHKDAEYHDGTFTQWSGVRSPDFPIHIDEGSKIGVADRDLTPWDEFTTKRDASPLEPPVGGSVEGDSEHH